MGSATCMRSNGSSVVDYICVRGIPLHFSIATGLFGGLSDHAPLLCRVQGPISTTPPPASINRTVYKWVDSCGQGSGSKSWQVWEALGDDSAFVECFEAAL